MLSLNKETRIKLKRFRRDRRAFYSFLFITAFFFISLPAEWLCNVRPILLSVDGRLYFPILFSYSEKDFGGDLLSEPDYKSERFLQLISGQKNASTANNRLPDFEEDDAGENNLGLNLGDFEDEEEEPGLTLNLEDFQEDDENPSPADQPVSPKSTGAGETRPAVERNFWILWPPIPYDYKYIPSQSRTGRVVLAAPY